MIYVSTMTYALGKELGLENARAEFQRQLADPGTDSLPCVRTIARLRTYDEVAIWHDVAATCLGKARARAFHSALESTPDVYITVDDDVEADTYTLGMLIEAVRGELGVCLAPCITRGSNVVNVAIEPGATERTLPSGGKTIAVRAGGFGLVAMSGDAMRAMVAAYPDLHFDDDHGAVKASPARKSAVFFDLLEPDGQGGFSWLGEDVAFCRRALFAGVRVEALVSGVTSHDGQVLKLETVTGLEVVQAPRAPLPQP